MENELPIVQFDDRSGGFADRCVHFRSMADNDTCKMGVHWDSVKVESPFRYRYRGSRHVYTQEKAVPCYKTWDPHGVCKCEHQRFPTAEDIAERKKYLATRFEMIDLAFNAISKATGGARGVSGHVDCPCCEGGKLAYSVSGYNGHVHASCNTPGCVRFMQ